MNYSHISPRPPAGKGAGRARHARALGHACLALAAVTLFSPGGAFLAQKRFTERYPTRKNVRLHLTNRSGTITVVAWDRDEIRITVEAESSGARVAPQVSADGLMIDVERDNRDRPDLGDVNFQINVPVNSMVDLETKRGNITVRGVEGALMRAHVTTEGDIELTGIRSSTVMAENKMGNILFDAELVRGGTYELRSIQGDISIRISADSGFRLMGLGRNINLGPFGAVGEFQFFGEKRRVIGRIGEGSSTLNVTNQRGTITFMRQ
ncbi:MAG: hypothetical protein ACRD68_13690 [Pyrinomonadaceae bacterium]